MHQQFSKECAILLTMKTVNARISSKNQLTLPAALVRKYKLDVNRNVTIVDKGGAITIRPEPTLEDRMHKAWKQLPPFKGVQSNEEFQQIAREAWADKNL